MANKKLHTATNECKTLAILAQEQQMESNLAYQCADCLIIGMHDKMTSNYVRLPGMKLLQSQKVLMPLPTQW